MIIFDAGILVPESHAAGCGSAGLNRSAPHLVQM